MYKSPIEIVHSQLRIQQENYILKAVQEYNITVDKEELLKALQYDREQYEKGFADGTRAIGRILERVEERSFGAYSDVKLLWLSEAIEIIKEEVG